VGHEKVGNKESGSNPFCSNRELEEIFSEKKRGRKPKRENFKTPPVKPRRTQHKKLISKYIEGELRTTQKWKEIGGKVY